MDYRDEPDNEGELTEVIEPCLEAMGFTQNEVLQALRQVLAEMHGSDI